MGGFEDIKLVFEFRLLGLAMVKGRYSMNLALVFTYISLCFYASASFGDVSIFRDKSNTILVVSKTILETDAADFSVLLKENLDVRLEVFLASSGGSVRAALDIGRMIRAIEIPVQVPEGATCASSCALIFFGGVDRSSYGKIGIHRPYFQVGPSSAPPTDVAIAEMYSTVKAYLSEIGVSPAIFEMMMITMPEDMRVFVGDSVFDIVPQTDPIRSERLVIQQAKRYGLDTVTYRETRLGAEETCAASHLQTDGMEETVRKAVASESCIDAKLWGVNPDQIESLNAQLHKACPLTESDSTKFHSYKADILLRALNGNGQGEIALDWYGFLPFLENQECQRRFFGR